MAGEQFVGREREIAALSALLDGVHRGRGAGVLLQGEGGIGKTRLVEEFTSDALRTGRLARVGWGGCADAELPPYWAWSQAFRSLRRDDIRTPASLFGGGQGQRAELFAQVIDALEDAAADGPLAFVLEDLHWIDEDSARLLPFVAASIQSLPILLVLTARDDLFDAPPYAAESLARLPSAVTRMHLRGLDGQATSSLAASVVGRDMSETWHAEIFRRTGGNPFFVTEVGLLESARHADTPPMVPHGVRHVISRRLARVPQAVVDIVGAAAVLGDESDVADIAAVAGTTGEEALELLDAAVRARLGLWRDARFRFAHALVQETVYEELSQVARRTRHERAARALEQRCAADPALVDDLAAPIAEHWSRARPAAPTSWAAQWSLAAARAAVKRLGFDQAVAHYRAALAGPLDDPLMVRVEFGEALLLAGEMSAARQSLYETADELAAEGSGELLARAALALGVGSGFEVDVFDQRQPALLAQALDLISSDDSRLRAALLARQSLALAVSDTPERRADIARHAAGMAIRVGAPDVEVAALSALNDAEAGPAFTLDRLANATRMLELAQAVNDPMLVLLARRHRVVSLLELGRLDEVVVEVERYADTADRLRLPVVSWLVPLWRGLLAVIDGDLTTAKDQLAVTESIGRIAESANAEMMVFTQGAAIARAAGDANTAVGLVASHPEWTERFPGFSGFAAVVMHEAGKVDAGRAFFHRAADAFDSLPADAEWLEFTWLLGEGAVRYDHRATAKRAYEALLPFHDLWAIDGIGGACFGVVAEQLGQLADYLGDTAAAGSWRAEAIARYRVAGASHFEARVPLESGPAPVGARVPRAEPAVGTFARDGAVWRIEWRGQPASVPNSKGMADLAELLRVPRRDIHVLDLVEASGGAPARAAAADTGPVLDARARAEYRSRIVDLEESIQDAEAMGNSALAEQLRGERDFLLEELARALGLGGRSRTTGSGVERARKAVAMRIGTALRAIDSVHPSLGRHLRASITTGRFCCYRPEDDVTWHTA